MGKFSELLRPLNLKGEIGGENYRVEGPLVESRDTQSRIVLEPLGSAADLIKAFVKDYQDGLFRKTKVSVPTPFHVGWGPRGKYSQMWGRPELKEVYNATTLDLRCSRGSGPPLIKYHPPVLSGGNLNLVPAHLDEGQGLRQMEILAEEGDPSVFRVWGRGISFIHHDTSWEPIKRTYLSLAREVKEESLRSFVDSEVKGEKLIVGKGDDSFSFENRSVLGGRQFVLAA